MWCDTGYWSFSCHPVHGRQTGAVPTGWTLDVTHSARQVDEEIIFLLRVLESDIHFPFSSIARRCHQDAGYPIPC